MYDNNFETKETKIETKDKIEPKHILPSIPTKWVEIHLNLKAKLL